MPNSSDDSPTAVVQRAFHAYEHRQWPAFAQCVHPDSLAEFRSQNLVMAEAWEEHRAFAPEQQADDSAAVDADFGGVRAFGTNPLVQGFARIASVAELRELTPQDCLARWLEGQAKDPSQYDDQRGPIQTRTVVGEVAENATHSHVVYRINTDVGRFGLTEDTAVITVRRGTNGWALLLNADISIMGSVRTIAVAPEASDEGAF